MTDRHGSIWLRPRLPLVFAIMHYIALAGVPAAAPIDGSVPGDGSVPDGERAAAEQGDPDALFALAERYETGDRVEQDLAIAVSLYRHAAERGHPLAQYRLGLALAFGIGVERNLADSRYWLLTSDHQGDQADALVAPILARIDRAISQEDKAYSEAAAMAFRPAEGPVSLPTPPNPPPRIESVDQDPEARLAAQLADQACGLVRMDVDAAGVVTIAAEVVDATITADLEGVDLRLTEVAPTICETLATLVGSDTSEGAGLEMRNQTGEPPEVFREGDHIVIDIPPAPERRHLTIDYYVHDGVVLHLLPNAELRDNVLGEGERMTLGQPGNGGQTWQVSPPFGNDLIVMHASPSPLSIGDRPAIENAEDYLDVLTTLLGDDHEDGDVQTTYQIVRTSP